MVQFHIYDIQKNPEGIAFEQLLDLKDELTERNPEILDVTSIQAVGKVRFEAGLYFLEYQLSYNLTMASSRSLKPVQWSESYPVMELFATDEDSLKDQELLEADMALGIEGETIVLDESVADNILLNLPVKVLTPEEEAGDDLPSGENWTVMTEEDFEAASQKKKEENSPFAQLQGLFDEE